MRLLMLFAFFAPLFDAACFEAFLLMPLFRRLRATPPLLRACARHDV